MATENMQFKQCASFSPTWLSYLWFEVSGFANIASFKMAANTESSEEENFSSDHLSLSEEDPIREVKLLGANLSVPKKATIVRKQKTQTNAADGKRRSY